MTQPMPCTHPESMRTYQTSRHRSITMCHRPGCGAVIHDTAAGLCRTPFVLVGDPDRIAMCDLPRGHAEPDHQETT